MESKIELNETWLHDKYNEGEINTSMSFVSFGDFYAQGEEADNIILEIHQYWLNNDVTTQEAVTNWCNMYL